MKHYLFVSSQHHICPSPSLVLQHIDSDPCQSNGKTTKLMSIHFSSLESLTKQPFPGNGNYFRSFPPNFCFSYIFCNSLGIILFPAFGLTYAIRLMHVPIHTSSLGVVLCQFVSSPTQATRLMSCEGELACLRIVFYKIVSYKISQ